MKFVDEAKIYVEAGAGGNGCLSFRREKFVEFGGPDGGDGGRGGHVYAEAAPGLNTLLDCRYRPHIKASRGGHGMGKGRTGANGRDVVLPLPVGTQIFDVENGFAIADLDEAGKRVMLARGGAGGRGNEHFKSSTNRAPRRTTPGEPGEERELKLRLKLLADAGLVGLPNAGKSTFLAATSRARPKIADYPFTTLVPMLGVIGDGNREAVLADLPGLIEGASGGKGIGDRFLGHVERCRVLLHLIDATSETPEAAYRTVRAELEAYGAGLAEKPEIVALSKADALAAQALEERRIALAREIDCDVATVSAVSGAGVEALIGRLLDAVDQAAAKDAPTPSERTGWSPVEPG